MVIQHKQEGNKGIYYIEEDGNVLAEIIYASGGDDLIIIEHTEVSDELKGQNVGFELVNKIVEQARMHGQKVAPVCTFAKAVFDKKPDMQDVLST